MEQEGENDIRINLKVSGDYLTLLQVEIKTGSKAKEILEVHKY